jgi:hypothetical protein
MLIHRNDWCIIDEQPYLWLFDERTISGFATSKAEGNRSPVGLAGHFQTERHRFFVEAA